MPTSTASHIPARRTESMVTDRSVPPEASGDVLARHLLEAVLTPKLRRLFKMPSRLILIHTYDETTAYLIQGYLGSMARDVVIEAITEPRKSGGQALPQGRSELSKLQYGHSVVLISQDPERLLVPEARIAADATIVVPRPSLTVVGKTIRAVTGHRIRGLKPSDLEGVTVLDIRMAIRPGLTGRQCVMNLRKASSARQEPPVTGSVPLEQLALTRPVSDWAMASLQIMRALNEGRGSPDALRFACLEGPPGTGKTTVAAALAHSAGWTFMPTSVGTWFARSGGHLGDVIRAAQAFFDAIATAPGPVVGLLDEIEALPNRAAMEPRDSQWWTPVVTFVLTEIDRIRKSGKPVLLIGATNHFDRLDAALIRPRRLEHRVSVLPPNEEERRALFANQLAGRLDANELSILARLSIGATPAQIESWCQSALAQVEEKRGDLSLADLLPFVAPLSGRSRQLDRAISIHEAGHAIAAVERGLPVSEISILARGAAGGWVNAKLEDRLLSRADVEDLAIMTLAGRAADVVLGGGPNAGAASDIGAVNTLLRSAMLEHGLYGPLTTEDNTDLRSWRDGVSVWSTITGELERLYGEAIDIVTRRQRDILKLAEVLLDERVVTGERMAQILRAAANDDDEAAEQQIMDS